MSSSDDDGLCQPTDDNIPIIEPELWGVQIDDYLLKPCMQNILADLKELEKGMSWIIFEFANSPGNYPRGGGPIFDGPLRNWKVVDGILVDGQNGSTSPKYDNHTRTVTSTFDSEQLSNTSDLSIARTMLHEAVHADLVLWSVETAGNVAVQEATYPDLFNDYLNNVNTNIAQHGEMAKSFMKGISDALEEFGNNRGYQLNKQFYNDLAWGGLTHIKNSSDQLVEAPWFLESFPNKSDRINNNIAVESTGKDVNQISKTKKGNNAGC